MMESRRCCSILSFLANFIVLCCLIRSSSWWICPPCCWESPSNKSSSAVSVSLSVISVSVSSSSTKNSSFFARSFTSLAYFIHPDVVSDFFFCYPASRLVFPTYAWNLDLLNIIFVKRDRSNHPLLSGAFFGTAAFFVGGNNCSLRHWLFLLWSPFPSLSSYSRDFRIFVVFVTERNDPLRSCRKSNHNV